MSVIVTESAAREINAIISQQGLDADKIRLRVGVKGGGCAGLSYVLSFEEPRPGDEAHVIDGIPCVIQPAHALYLHGMEVDWGTGLDARGFVFRNPNASATCGCGSSFAV